MGFLVRFTRNADMAARETWKDAHKLELWIDNLEKHYPERRELSVFFSTPNNIKYAIRDRVALAATLVKIRYTIKEDLVSEDDFKKTEDEIISDLKLIIDAENHKETERLQQGLAYEEKKEEYARKLLEKIHWFLHTELHAIKILLKTIDKAEDKYVEDILRNLYMLIFYKEEIIYRIFLPKTFKKEETFKSVNAAVRAVLIESDIRKMEVSTEHKFIALMIRHMNDHDSKHNYRKLAEFIYERLGLRAKLASYSEMGTHESLMAVEQLVDDEENLKRIVSELKPQYQTDQIEWTVRAFKKAHQNNELHDLMKIMKLSTQ